MVGKTVVRDEEREQRIARIVAGCDEEYGRIAEWYGYLEEHIHFPFAALYRTATAVSRGQRPEPVEVIDLACVDNCTDEMRVTLGAKKYGHDVPLSQVQPTDAADEQTRQAIGDWHYWVQRGYHFWTETEE